MNPVVVIADDVTGAAELAGIAARRGLRAEVQTEFQANTACDVVCVDTDTRSMPPSEAARVVGAVARQVALAKPKWVFKKCDSVLRGPVLAEARATAEALGKTRLMILPANPSRGRIVRNGVYFVAGRPLHETMFAGDPDHPRRTSRVVEMMDGDLANVDIPDAESLDDVARQARGVDPSTLPVGGADFFEALIGLWHGAAVDPVVFYKPSIGPATLMVCGSAVSWVERRQKAEAEGIPVFVRPLPVGQIVEQIQGGRRVLMGVGDGSTQGSSQALVIELAEAAAGILRAVAVGSLMLEGGATASAVLRAMRWTRLQAIPFAGGGTGALRPTGVDGPDLFIKPGSYPWPEALWPRR